MNTGSRTCQAVRDAMVLFLYGEASEAEDRMLRAHHATCGPCAEEWERLSSIAQTISRAEDGRSRPMLAGVPRKLAARRTSVGFLSLAAAVLFVALVGVAAFAPSWRRALLTSGPASERGSSRASASSPRGPADSGLGGARGALAASGATTAIASTSAGAASDAATNVIASKRAGAAPGAAGRASGAKTSEVSEDVLEAELRSLDQALSTLESGHEEL